MASPRQKLVSDSESEEPLQDDAQCNTHHELPAENDTIVTFPNLPLELPMECGIDSPMYPLFLGAYASSLTAAGQLAMTAVMKVRTSRYLRLCLRILN